MKSNDFEKYITELSPELQEKARQCKNKDELNELLADNDVELSEDALEAVAGGEYSDSDQGNDYPQVPCPECGHLLHRSLCINTGKFSYFCDNRDCIAFLFWEFDENGNRIMEDFYDLF